MKHQIYVIGNQDDEMCAVRYGQICLVIKRYFYNGETWYDLQDIETMKTFSSPEIFWDKYTYKK